MDSQIELLKKYPCPICSQSEYEFGQLIGHGAIHFVAGTPKFWSMPRDPWRAPKRALARICVHCRNIQSFERQFTTESEDPK